jgi:hypothetical protein
VPDGRLRVERPRRCADVRAPTPRDALGERGRRPRSRTPATRRQRSGAFATARSRGWAPERPRQCLGNTQVTYSPSPANARNESELEASPLNALNSTGDDKQWATGRSESRKPLSRHVYAAWDEGSSLAFARAIDQGATWRGVGTQAVGSHLAA